MNQSVVLSEDIADQIHRVLSELRARTQAECVLLADVSGQLVESLGSSEEIDPVLVAALAAGELAAIAELARQIGERRASGSLLHEGKNRSIYIASVSDTFVLVVIFSTASPVGLVRLFVRRAAELLHPLASQFEEAIRRSNATLGTDFGTALAGELDEAFGGM